MKVHRDLTNIPPFRNAVITIGSYDGVHAGHQQIIRRLKALAEEIGGESIIITFDPHPRHVIYPDDKSLKLITTTDEKAELLQQYGVDHVVIVPFTKEFSKQTPDEYIQHFLVEKFHPKRIVIGYDHKFGNKRAGNIDYLKKFEDVYGFTVEEISKQTVEDMAVSSTKVRMALAKGEIEEATTLLQHPFYLGGEVVKGKQLGASIGFPTANVQIANPYKIIPTDGIYAVNVYHGSVKYGGMLYIGKSLSNIDRTIEVNIFDFDKSIYGEHLNVEFVKHIREDERFASLDALTIQLGKDKELALSVLKKKA